MSEPNSPGQPKASEPNGSASTNGTVQFDSTMSTKAGQPKDYFAEQNQKNAEKKQKTNKVRKKVLIVGGIVALIAIIVVIVVVVINTQHSGPTVIGGGDQDGDDSALSGVQSLNGQVTEVFNPTYSVNDEGEVVVNGNLDAAESTFEAALANPANKDRIDTIYLAQIVFYSSLGDNQRVVEIAEKVNPNKLNLSEKIKFYNLTYLAYAALGNNELKTHYYNLMREAANKVTGIGG